MGGGDKALIAIGGTAILDRVIARLRPATTAIILNANGDPARFARYGLPVVADSVPDFAGPLAGILAGLDWAVAHAPELEWIASAPGDCRSCPMTSFPLARVREAAPLSARARPAAGAAGGRPGRWRTRRPAPGAGRRGLHKIEV
jgi:molybdopterin-guanine dinucleotide biosynthesis protein A